MAAPKSKFLSAIMAALRIEPEASHMPLHPLPTIGLPTIVRDKQRETDVYLALTINPTGGSYA
jgi:hypothetical protein